MKKFIAFVMLFAGLFSISYNAFEHVNDNEVQTRELAKKSDKEVREGTEDEGIFLT